MADPLTELERIAHVANIKRQALRDIAHRRARMAKNLQLAAGVLALLSAGSITAIIADVTGPGSVWIKILSAVLSFVSGIIGLVSTTYYDEQGTQSIYGGADSFHLIRERADLTRDRPGITTKQAYDELSKIRPDYRNSSKAFDRYLPRIIREEGPYAEKNVQPDSKASAHQKS